MKLYKLVALDLDGTLLNERKEISAENLEAIRQALAAGVAVIFSTGRGIQNVRPYLQLHELAIPVVAVNGSEVWKSEHELLTRHLLPVEDIRSFHELAVRYNTWWWTYAVEGAFNRANWVESIEHIQWLKFCYQTEDDKRLEEIREHVLQIGTYELTNSHHDNIEINPKGISKASGVREICQLLNISMSEVIAIGDSGNDISMICAAGLGVAMGNAQEIVKQQADVIAKTNEEHGVAEIIHRYIL